MSSGWDDAAVERGARAYEASLLGPFAAKIELNRNNALERRMTAMRAALNAAAPRESLSVEPPPNPSEREGLETEIFQLVVRLHERADGQAEWLRENAPFCTADQKHLDENTPERAYWHYGYMVALRDVLGKLDHALESKSGDGSTPQTLSPAPRGEEGWVLEARALIATCAVQFRFYELQYAAKQTPEADAKAIVNRDFAKRCEAMLAAAPKAP